MALTDLPASLLFAIGQSGKWLFQALHQPAQALQPLPRLFDPLRFLKLLLDPIFCYRQGFPPHAAGRKQPPPTPYYIFIRPSFRRGRINPHQYVKVVIHDRETTD